MVHQNPLRFAIYHKKNNLYSKTFYTLVLLHKMKTSDLDTILDIRLQYIFLNIMNINFLIIILYIHNV